MPMLAGKYTLVSVDLRGAGESTVAKTGYDKKTLARMFMDWLNN